MTAPARSRSPFRSLAPSIAAALAHAAAGMVWTIAGANLPGGRWLAVHLFTLGVLTNLVLAFTEHFGRTLTHAPAVPIRWQAPVLNTGVVLTLVGRTSDTRWATAAGATLVTGVVVIAHRRLRRLRQQAIGARFAWIVRIYERAHGAFVLGAVLGLLMGIGTLRGSWYAAARTAHLHVNLLGWGGLTLLATLVFFGPTIVRTRIVEGADERAAPALRHGATGLTIAVLLLLATGVGAPFATVLRLAAAAAMAVYARAVTVVCLPVAVAARAAKPTATRWAVVAVAWWFPLVAWADVGVLAAGAWRWLDAVGLAVILGVLAQTMLAVLTYLAPMLRGEVADDRARVRTRLEVGATARTTIFNAGVVTVVAAALVRGTVGGVLVRSGWLLVVLGLAWLVAVGLGGVRVRREP